MKISFLLVFLMLIGCDKRNEVPSEEKKTAHQPLTDGVHVDVYTFIGEFLEKDWEYLTPSAVQKYYESQVMEIKDRNYKPHIADIVEGEIAGLLRLLLLKDDHFENITLYKRDGVGIATSGMRQKNLSFNKRPPALTLGFLTQEVLSGQGIYQYPLKNTTYEEHILPIYKKDDVYLVGKLPYTQDSGFLIGYLSYIVSKG